MDAVKENGHSGDNENEGNTCEADEEVDVTVKQMLSTSSHDGGKIYDLFQKQCDFVLILLYSIFYVYFFGRKFCDRGLYMVYSRMMKHIPVFD